MNSVVCRSFLIFAMMIIVFFAILGRFDVHFSETEKLKKNIIIFLEEIHYTRMADGKKEKYIGKARKTSQLKSRPFMEYRSRFTR